VIDQDAKFSNIENDLPRAGISKRHAISKHSEKSEEVQSADSQNAKY
jgi:hypothetical protein